MSFQTDCIATGEDRSRFHGSIPPPIYESSLFTFSSHEALQEAIRAGAQAPIDAPYYTRTSNPTVRVLEQKIALLEGGEDCRMLASGMAAVSAAILSAARSGDHIVAVQSIYSNSFRLLNGYLPRLGITTTFVDFTDITAAERALRPDTRLLYLESPGNPAMHLVDMEAAVSLARKRGLTTIMDSSLATPYNQHPLAYGVDLVVHTASKYLSGHSDVVAGAIVGNRERLERISGEEIRDVGGIIGPFEAWLILRGIRTLGLRMKAHNEAGSTIACWLEERPEVERVYYAGLPSHPQYDLARRQMTGFSGLIGVVLKGGQERAVEIANRLELFGIGVSWGGFEILALPLDAAESLSPEIAEAVGIVPGFLRLSIGLEDVDDLIADLDQALRTTYS